MTDLPPVLLSPKEVAARLRVHRETVLRWIRAGSIRYERVGDTIWIPWPINGTAQDGERQQTATNGNTPPG